jgi:hypothetical protein
MRFCSASRTTISLRDRGIRHSVLTAASPAANAKLHTALNRRDVGGRHFGWWHSCSWSITSDIAVTRLLVRLFRA